MMFKTVTDDITGTTKSISIFNSTLSTMKRNIKNGQGLVYSIFNGNKVTQNDIQSINDYAKAVNNGADHSQAFRDNMLGCSVAAKQYVLDAKRAGKSTDELVNGLKEVPKYSGAATVGLNILSAAGNMLVMWGVSEAIGLVITKLNEFVNADKIARESAKEFADASIDSISKISDNSKKINELNSEYQELSKHVTATGVNIDLPSDKYDRYKQIISEISDIMPNLATYFNQQGEKIGFVKGQLADANKEYEKYVQNDAIKALSNDDDDGNKIQDVLDAYNSNNSKGIFSNIWSSVKAQFGFTDEDSLENSKILWGLKNIHNASQEEVAEALEYVGPNNRTSMVFDRNKLSAILREMLDVTPDKVRNMTGESFGALQDSIKANLDSIETQIESDMISVRTTLIRTAQSSDEFWNIDDLNIRSDITTFLSSITSDIWNQLDNKTEIDFRVFVNKIISAMSQNKDGFADAWNNLFSLDQNKLNTEEYIAKVQQFISTICATLGINNNEIQKRFAISLGFDIEEEQTAEKALKSKLGKFDDNIKTKIIQTLTVTELKNAVNSDTIEWSSLTPENYKGTADEIANNISSNIRNSLNKQDITKDSTPSLTSFTEAWSSLGKESDEEKAKASNTLKENLLELASAGKLTEKTFNQTEGAKAWV